MSRTLPEIIRSLSGALLLTSLTMVVGGCAQTGGPATVDARSSERATPAPKERARVEVEDGTGFTVTEVVHIDAEVRGRYLRAVTLLQQDRHEEGIALLEQVVAEAPELTAPHIDLGVAYGRIGAHDKAQASLESAVALAPDHPVALNELGIAYRRTGKFDAARRSYERALGVDPGYHFALRNLGVLCDLYLEDLPCALANYESYAAIVADDEQVRIWIADIRNRLTVGQ